MRYPDKVHVEAVGVGVVDNLTSVEIVNDLMSPSEGSFELGNAGTWPDIAEQVKHGTPYKVFINDRLRLTGRVEVTDQPADAQAGSVVRFVVRTKLADAMYASAPPNVKIKNASIKQFILQLYAPLGFTESDFIFSSATARDLLSGKDSAGAGGTVDLQPLTAQDAKVNPGDTIYDSADRILRRYGMIHWDSPDGRIVVGAPFDGKAPLYFLRMNQGWTAAENNILGSTPTQDWSGVPSSVTVVGSKVIPGRTRSKLSAMAKAATDEHSANAYEAAKKTAYKNANKATAVEVEGDVAAAGFYRPIVLMAEGIRSPDMAVRAAYRELSARRRGMDAWPIEIDGLSYWTGMDNVNWAVDEVAQIESNVIGRPSGAYYLHRVMCRRNAQRGDVSNLSLVRKGLWIL